VIESPNYPTNYPPRVNCAYTLQSEPGKQIRIRVTNFALEPGYHSDPCGYDSLTIDGEQYCGFNNAYSEYPQEEFIIDAEATVVRFETDGGTQYSGFRLEFDSYDPNESDSDSCDLALFNDGVIESPQYPLNYPDDANCAYSLQVDPGHYIKITVTHFDVEEGGSGGALCGYDTLTIDGQDYCGFANAIDGVYAGYPPEEIIIEAESTVIQFQSDGAETYSGFRLEFDSIPGAEPSPTVEPSDACFQSLTGSGSVLSTGFPFQFYGANEMCAYTLQADPGMDILVRITHLDTEEPATPGVCFNDFLDVNYENRFCGSFAINPTDPEEIWINSENAVVTWTSNDAVQAMGFRFEFESVDPTDAPTTTTTTEAPTTTTTTAAPAVDVTQEGASFWAHFSEFYELTKAQMESGDRPWKTPHFTWMFNNIMNEDPVSYSQMSGDCTWALETGNPHPTYEAVEIEFFDASVDRCVNLMAMSDMGLSYVESYACMTGHPKPRGTLRRWKMWMNGIRELGEFFCSP